MTRAYRRPPRINVFCAVAKCQRCDDRGRVSTDFSVEIIWLDEQVVHQDRSPILLISMIEGHRFQNVHIHTETNSVGTRN